MSGWLQHYHHITEMPDGRRAGIQRLLFTVAVCVGIDDYGCWQQRYCFATLADALKLMSDYRISGIPVVENDSKKLVGILTNRDVRFATNTAEMVSLRKSLTCGVRMSRQSWM